MVNKKRKGLGALGVDVLISSSHKSPIIDGDNDDTRIKQIGIVDIVPNKHQPRQNFSQESLEELAESLKSQGLIQPIIVRPAKDKGFELIAGERRWRAAQIAGMTKIPAIVRQIDDSNAAALALIENIQREDLSPIEEAQAFQRLITYFDLTHEKLSEILGRSRPAISNTLRLLALNDSVLEMLNRKQLDMGHARALLSLTKEEQGIVALKVLQDEMTVNQTEQYVSDYKNRNKKKRRKRGTKTSPEVKQLQKQLSEKLSTDVTVKHKPSGSGSLNIHYSSLDVLDGILKKIH